ncbi:MAG: helix-turn-helix domain-containing protein [Gammaproteobacteria bacterium]|nr:helix-turn-helix domain-containing protein [Gammaproteobacteria bacterium]
MSTPKESLFKLRLLQTRKMRKLNQDELANKAGLPSTAISHFESGARKPSFDNLRKLADALEVSIDYLMGRVDSISGDRSMEAEIFRDYENLTDDDRELARDFMARLAKRNKDK